ncbi:MAG: ATP-binding protein [Burkholderiales bacterium]|nr:ATP-binding protein [Burkholderiales bacterium]
MAFDLSHIVRGQDLRPPRIMLYGVEGIGKTTFGASAPAPIFIFTEESLGTLDVPRFPLAASYDDVMSAITALYSEPHKFQTVCIDSLDWLEAHIWTKVRCEHAAADLSYGKDSVLAANEWRALLDGLNALRNERGMTILLIAHCHIKRFDSPETEPFDRYIPKLQDRSNALIREWSDAVLFANYSTIVKSENVGFNQTVRRGITTGERLLHTTEKPAYMAKNRYALPDALPLSWDALQAAIAAQAAPQPATT